MAKKLLTSYSFTPGAANAGTVVVSGTYELEQFLLITNVTDGVTIFQFNKSTKGGTVSTGGGNTTLTLEADTSSMSAGDRLQLFVDDGLPGQVTLTNASVEISNDSGSPVPISAAGLPLPTGAATQATLASIDAKTPALQSGRVPVEVQDAAGTVIDPATEQSLEILRAMFRLLKPLGQVTGAGRNHLAVDIANTASVQGTITANQGGTWNIGTVTTVTNSQMGGVWGFDHAKALSRQAYNSGIRPRVS